MSKEKKDRKCLLRLLFVGRLFFSFSSSSSFFFLFYTGGGDGAADGAGAHNLEHLLGVLAKELGGVAHVDAALAVLVDLQVVVAVAQQIADLLHVDLKVRHAHGKLEALGRNVNVRKDVLDDARDHAALRAVDARTLEQKERRALIIIIIIIVKKNTRKEALASMVCVLPEDVWP